MRGLSTDQRDWHDLGLLDPLWAVWSIPEYRFGGGDLEGFFRRGEEEVAALLAEAQGNHGLPKRRERALDFGCGVGRLTRALGRRFDAVTGVDISRSMIEAAKSLNPGHANCSFELNAGEDLDRFANGHFDLVCSLITLQHVSRRAAVRRYISEFVRVTAPGGLVVFQLPTHVAWRIRFHPRRPAYHALRALGFPIELLYRRGLYSMALTSLSQAEVLRTVQASGGTLLACQPDQRSGTPFIPSNTYYVTPTQTLR
ncbi:MAG: class I SAM-dependent methyltransferase [Actinobacteria bacterium]|nr:MAG: class I SAM-dependent methyltransferase [Actinomycetota bacterium]